MKNVFIEGIQGMGKSTLLNTLAASFPEYQVCREGDCSPVDLAWCAWMTEEEYETALKRYSPLECGIESELRKQAVRENGHFIVPYTKIITDIPGFHKDMERFEIYNGRKTFWEFKEIIFSRYENFFETGWLFECAFFQNIIEELMLFHLLSDDEILGFYRELYDRVSNKEQFLLLYLYSDKIEDYIGLLQRERCDDRGNDMWYQLMLRYLAASPYGRKQKRGYPGFTDLAAHFRHRQHLELRIMREILSGRAVILPARDGKPSVSL